MIHSLPVALRGLLCGAVVAVLSAGAVLAEPIPFAAVEYREVPSFYPADGVVEAVRQSTVSAQISGRITEVDFDVGDRVRKGQVLVRIDESEVGQALAESQAVLAQAEANLANAKSNYERSRQLKEKGFLSQAALDRAQSEYDASRSQVEARRAASGIAATTRGHATVIAPYAGVVTARHVELGEMATPGKPLMTGFDPGQMRVVASLPQARVKDFAAKAGAFVEFPALGWRVNAASATLQPSADARTHTSRVRLELPPDLEGVYPGMFARAWLPVGTARKLVIPVSAVLRRSEVAAVYALDATGAPRLRQVRLGEPAGEDGIEVLAGLKPGDKVALDPVKAGISVK